MRPMGALAGPCGRETLSPRSYSFSGTKSLGPSATYLSKLNLCFCICKIKIMTCLDFLLRPSIFGPSQPAHSVPRPGTKHRPAP